MKIDLGSFAYGSVVTTGGNTPSWGTALGQIRPELNLTYSGCDKIIMGMVNKSIPVDKVYIPLGRGGHISNSLDDKGILLAALFDVVYVNGTRVNASYILAIYREDTDCWSGRKTLKYNDKIEYHRGEGDIISNLDFKHAVEEALELSEEACWFVTDISIYNQNELHFTVKVVDPFQTVTYPDSKARKRAWVSLLFTDDQPYYKFPIEAPFQQIFYGAPGTGKSYIIDKSIKEKKLSVVRTTFHPDSDYSTFVGSYKPVMEDKTIRVVPVVLNDGINLNQNEGTYKERRISYKFVMQAFMKSYLSAWQKMVDNPVSPEAQILVIEEINRGNCAQIFGDIFQLLDRADNGFSTYPIATDEDLQHAISEAFKTDYQLPGSIYVEGVVKDYTSNYGATLSEDIQEGRVLLLPSNLYIWATMNTSDQSLFPIDSAFKRRWDWKYMKIKEGKDENGESLNWVIDVNVKYADNEDKPLPWWIFLKKINEIIASMTSSADKQLGYFFCKASDDGKISAEKFVGKVIFYLWNDVFKDYGFEDASLFRYTEKDKNGKDVTKELTFPDFYKDDGEEINLVRLVDFIEKVMNWKNTNGENN